MRSRAIPLLAAAMILTGCNGGAVPATQVMIDIATFAFDPETTAVRAGTTVTWVNKDATRHTVTAGSQQQPSSLFDEEVSAVGDEVTVTFDDPGTYPYFCVLHPFMTGVIEVAG